MILNDDLAKKKKSILSKIKREKTVQKENFMIS